MMLFISYISKPRKTLKKYWNILHSGFHTKCLKSNVYFTLQCISNWTSHISHAPQPQVARGRNTGQWSSTRSTLCQGFPGGSDGKESACNSRDLGLIPGLGRSPGEGNGYPLECSCLENSMDRGAWQVTVYGITKSPTRLSNCHFLTKQYLPLKYWLLSHKQPSLSLVMVRASPQEVLFDLFVTT